MTSHPTGVDDDEDADDDEERTRVFIENSACRMKFSKKGESMSYYIMLLFAQDARKPGNNKVPTLIDVTRNPLEDVVDHNQGNAKYRFAGKNNGCLCKVQQIIGPVDTYAEALEIQSEWKANSRGLAGRGDEGRALAKRYGKPLWDAHADREYEKLSKRVNRKK